MSTFCICVRRLSIISSLMPSLPRNCSRPRLPPSGWPHSGQMPPVVDFIGVVSLEVIPVGPVPVIGVSIDRSEEHTSELQHQIISYAVFCLKKKSQTNH